MKRLRLIVWIILIVLGVLTAYVNNYMPRGEYYPTVYENDEGREIYFEDLRELNIPNWAKFLLRTHTRDLFFTGVIVVIVMDVLIKRFSN
jgi:hypothetical protein